MKTSSKYRKNSALRRDAAKTSPETPKLRVWRLRTIQVVLFLIALLIFARLLQIQVLRHEKYEELAKEQYLRQYVQKAHRGLILDRNLKTLALNEPSYDIGLHKRNVSDYKGLSGKMASVLKKDRRQILDTISSDNLFVFIDRKTDEDAALAIRAMDLSGVTVFESSRRQYPLKENLAQVLGFVDIDGNGLSGIEYEFDDYLRGSDGASMFQRDATGKDVLQLRPAENHKNGDNLVLTIDHVIQTIIEEELATAVKKYKAKGGSIIVTNPQNGEILGMASYPGFDANNASEYKAESWRIRCITDIYEPGSTFKIVTLMAALSEKTRKLDDIIFCENGKFQLYGETINDHEKYGWLTFKDVFKNSSNIGTAKIAIDVGKEKLYQAARAFGFGNRTGIRLPGEVAGMLKNPTQWSRFSIAAISYGYEVAVTPLQMAMAYGAIANGGLLLQPYIVKEVRNTNGEKVKDFHPEVIRRVMTPEIASTMRDILAEAVEDGTGEQARIEHINIAGKTGTARKKLEGKPGYSNSKYIGSFAGFYPTEDARFLIYIMIDEPTTIHWGGYVAAPTFKNILKRILDAYAPIPEPNLAVAQEETKPSTPYVPDLRGKRIEVAQKILKDLQLRYNTSGSGVIVEEQEVVAHSKSPEVLLVLSQRTVSAEYTTMPKIVGLSMREAIAAVSSKGLSARIFGSGQVVRQEPEAGSKIKAGAQCMIECQPVKSVTLIRGNRR